MESTRRVKLQGLDKDELPVDIVTEDGIGLIRHVVLENYMAKQNHRFNTTVKLVYCRRPEAVVECSMTDTVTGRSVIKVGETCEKTLKGEIAMNFAITMAYQRAYNRAAIALLGLSEEGQIYSDCELDRSDLSRRKGYIPENTASVKQVEVEDDIGMDIIPFTEPEKMPEKRTPKQETEKAAEKPVKKPAEQQKPEQADSPKQAPIDDQLDGYTMTDDTIVLVSCAEGKPLKEAKETKAFKTYVEWAKSNDSEVAFKKEEQRKQYLFLKYKYSA